MKKLVVVVTLALNLSPAFAMKRANTPSRIAAVHFTGAAAHHLAPHPSAHLSEIPKHVPADDGRLPSAFAALGPVYETGKTFFVSPTKQKVTHVEAKQLCERAGAKLMSEEEFGEYLKLAFIPSSSFNDLNPATKWLTREFSPFYPMRDYHGPYSESYWTSVPEWKYPAYSHGAGDSIGYVSIYLNDEHGFRFVGADWKAHVICTISKG